GVLARSGRCGWCCPRCWPGTEGSGNVARPRTKTTQEPEAPPLLRVVHEDFVAELDERIELGKELLEDVLVVSSDDGLANRRRKYGQCSDYSRELLTRRFTTTEIATSYTHRASAGVIPLYEATLDEKVEDLASEVDKKLGRLESLRGRVKLIETVPGLDGA